MASPACRHSDDWTRVVYEIQSRQHYDVIILWLLSDEAQGYYTNQVGIYMDKRGMIRFSDPNTAFAFKMRFG